MHDTAGILEVAQQLERVKAILVEQLVEPVSGATDTPQGHLTRRIRQRRVEAFTRRP